MMNGVLPVCLTVDDMSNQSIPNISCIMICVVSPSSKSYKIQYLRQMAFLDIYFASYMYAHY